MSDVKLMNLSWAQSANNSIQNYTPAVINNMLKDMVMLILIKHMAIP